VPAELARALNRESGRVYTATLVHHYRVYRQSAHLWLNPRRHDRLLKFFCGETFLHAHSYQAAQQDFYEACKTAKALKQVNPLARYPYKRKFYHTTTWKNTGIMVTGGRMRLALGQGHDPMWVDVPEYLVGLPETAYKQVQLVYDITTRQNHWHLTIDDGVIPQACTAVRVMAVDLGEIHPAACTNGDTATIISCRALRANAQHRNKKTADLQERIARCTKGSRRWKKLTLSRKKLQARTEKRQRDLLHKVSRAVVDEAQAMEAGTIVLGDVRTISDKTRIGKRNTTKGMKAARARGEQVQTDPRLNRENRQKIANWPHGQLRQYVTYKAAAVGVAVELINEAYTSQTCPTCGHLNKPQGRNYSCSQCGYVGQRDNVGSANILSKHQTGKLAQMRPCQVIKYRHPYRVRPLRASVDRGDARHVARASENPKPLSAS
jgi:putative transposase